MEEQILNSPRLKDAETFVKLSTETLPLYLSSFKDFLFVVTGDKCPRCDLLKELLHPWIKENKAFIGEANYFEVYKKLKPEDRGKYQTPRIAFFPTVIAYHEQKPVLFKAIDHLPEEEEVEEIFQNIKVEGPMVLNASRLQKNGKGQPTLQILDLNVNDAQALRLGEPIPENLQSLFLKK